LARISLASGDLEERLTELQSQDAAVQKLHERLNTLVEQTATQARQAVPTSKYDPNEAIVSGTLPLAPVSLSLPAASATPPPASTPATATTSVDLDLEVADPSVEPPPRLVLIEPVGLSKQA
jgi:hypothetical protein